MTIHIEALTFDAIIGLLDFEKERAQRVVIDLEASYAYTPGTFIDYEELSVLIMDKVQHAHYELLEDALIQIEGMIRAKYPKITFLYLKISKPDILNNCTVSLSHQWNY